MVGPAGQLVVGVALLLVVYRAGIDALAGLTRLGWADYRARSPLGRLMRTGRGWAAGGLVAAPWIVVWMLGGRSWGWAPLGEAAWGVRLVAVVCGWALAWSSATAAWNYHFGRWHGVERVLLVVCAAGVWFSPLAVGPLVVVLLVVLGSLDHPSCVYTSRTPLLVPRDLLVLAGLGGWLAGLGAVEPGAVVVALVACAGSHYAIAGVAKVALPNGWSWWLVTNRIERLFVCAHANGWLARWPWERVQRVAGVLGSGARGLAVATLVLELGAGVMLIDPWLTVAVLAGCVAMHAGIVLASGIFFWKWMVGDAALAGLVVSVVGTPAAAFGVWPMLVGLGVVAVSPWIFRPVWLGWSDTGLTNHFVFEAVGVCGERAELPRGAFAPYDIAFCQSRFHCLHDRPVLAGVFGSVATRSQRAREAVAQLAACDGSPGRVRAIVDACGVVRGDPLQAQRLAELVVQRVATLGRAAWLEWLGPPRHIMLGCASGGRAPRWRIARVEVRFVRQFYDGLRLETIEDEVVRVIEMPAGDGVAARAA